MIEDWKKDFIIKRCKETATEEKRQFAIAYKNLDEKYHGYLTTMSKGQKIFNKNIDDEDLKQLKKTCKVKQWTKKDGKDSGLMVDFTTPYLTLDGYLAILNDETEESNVTIEIIERGSKTYVKATVSIPNKGVREGIADLAANENNIDKTASSAIRKALTYYSFGRFPMFKTEYGEDKLIKEFRAFKSNKGGQKEK